MVQGELRSATGPVLGPPLTLLQGSSSTLEEATKLVMCADDASFNKNSVNSNRAWWRCVPPSVLQQLPIVIDKL